MKCFHLGFGSSLQTNKYPVIDKQRAFHQSIHGFHNRGKERQTFYMIGCLRLYCWPCHGELWRSDQRRRAATRPLPHFSATSGSLRKERDFLLRFSPIGRVLKGYSVWLYCEEEFWDEFTENRTVYCLWLQQQYLMSNIRTCWPGLAR